MRQRAQDQEARALANLAMESENSLCPFFEDYVEIQFPFSLFRPRGHYTRSEKLQRYFRGMMWLQTAPFGMDNKEEVQQGTRPFMERVMEIMEQNYTNSGFGVQEFCDAIGMSRSVASKHLNAEVGVPVGQFIRNYRLNMAKELLSAKTGNRNITEIAYKVGFNDPKYFTRCFTKMFGVSPSSYTAA